MHLRLCVVINILLRTLSHIILLAVKKEDEEIDEQAKKNDDKKEDVLELEKKDKKIINVKLEWCAYVCCCWFPY